MSDSLPEDVAALCSHAGIDSSRYKDFTSRRNADSASSRAAGYPADIENAPPPVSTSSALPDSAQEIPVPVPVKLSATHHPQPPPVPVPRPEHDVTLASAMTSNLLELPVTSHWGPPAVQQPHVPESPRSQRNRWSALQEAFSLEPSSNPAGSSAHAMPPGSVSIFGVGGGVGKTTIAASLARVLTGGGESILVAGLSTESILPLYFGARSVSGSGLRSFLLPGQPGRGSLHLYLDAPNGNDAHDGTDVLYRLCVQAEVTKGDLDRAILVFPSGSPEPLMPVLRSTYISLAIIVPDLVSAIGVGKLIRFFNEHPGRPVSPYFLINKFDSARPLHQEMRNRLHEQLGARLLPLVIRRSDDIQDALVAGLTVIDYAPGTGVAQDLQQLADWIVSHTFRGSAGR